jgi:hypothetical protein
VVGFNLKENMWKTCMVLWKVCMGNQNGCAAQEECGLPYIYIYIYIYICVCCVGKHTKRRCLLATYIYVCCMHVINTTRKREV